MDSLNNPETKVSDSLLKNFQKETVMNFVQVGLG